MVICTGVELVYCDGGLSTAALVRSDVLIESFVVTGQAAARADLIRLSFLIMGLPSRAYPNFSHLEQRHLPKCDVCAPLCNLSSCQRNIHRRANIVVHGRCRRGSCTQDPQQTSEKCLPRPSG